MRNAQRRARPTDARGILRILLDQIDPEPITPTMTNREAQAAVMRALIKLRTAADGESAIYDADPCNR